jgi:hypothetical protein
MWASYGEQNGGRRTAEPSILGFCSDESPASHFFQEFATKASFPGVKRWLFDQTSHRRRIAVDDPRMAFGN